MPLVAPSILVFEKCQNAPETVRDALRMPEFDVADVLKKNGAVPNHNILSSNSEAQADIQNARELLGKSYLAADFEKERGKDVMQAIADCTAAIKLDPHCAFLYAERAETKGYGGAMGFKYADGEGALADFTTAIALDPTNPGYYRSRAEVLSALGRFDEAYADATQAIKLDPKTAHEYEFRALLSLDHGDYAASIKDYSQAINIDPKNEVLFEQRARANDFVGNWREAIIDRTQNLKLNLDFLEARANVPNDGAIVSVKIDLGGRRKAFEAYENEARSMHEKGENEKALLYAEQACVLDPSSAQGINNRGCMKYFNGDLKGANEDFKAAARTAPTDEVVRQNADIDWPKRKKHPPPEFSNG